MPLRPEDRVAWVGRLGAAAFAVLILGLAYLQIIRGPLFRSLASRNAFRVVPIAAPRGDIVDRRGIPLATNRLSFDIAIVPQDAPALEFVLGRVAELTEQPVTDLRRKFARSRSLPFAPAIIIADAPMRIVMLMEEHRHELPGVLVLPHPTRDYPHGTLAAHVIGSIGPIDAQELERRRGYGYRLHDWVGKNGVEAVCDAYLRGEDGGMVIEVDHRGRQIRIVSRRDPVPGQPVTLSLDAELQQLIEEQFGGRAGACVVLQPRTGEVLALASSPAFEPAAFVSERSKVVAWLKDKQQPLVNRAIRGNYPPGSIFKLVTATAALEERKITPVTTFTCGGSLVLGGRAFHCWKRDGHGVEFLRRGLAHSCNVYFMQLGLAAGIDGVARWAHRLGIGTASGIDLPGEQAGFMPTRAWKKQMLQEAWYDGDTANIAIGQGHVLLTPLQAARLAAVFANGGWLVKPHVIRRIGNMSVPQPAVHAAGISASTRQSIVEGLIDVVAAPDGTGHRAWEPGIGIAGKTGTAQTHRPGMAHAWMLGFTPVEQPEAAFGIVFEFGGSGGHLPALMAQKIAELLELRHPKPAGDAS